MMKVTKCHGRPLGKSKNAMEGAVFFDDLVDVLHRRVEDGLWERLACVGPMIFWELEPAKIRPAVVRSNTRCLVHFIWCVDAVKVDTAFRGKCARQGCQLASQDLQATVNWHFAALCGSLTLLTFSLQPAPCRQSSLNLAIVSELEPRILEVDVFKERIEVNCRRNIYQLAFLFTGKDMMPKDASH